MRGNIARIGKLLAEMLRGAPSSSVQLARLHPAS
jgi:hypothetical protein